MTEFNFISEFDQAVKSKNTNLQVSILKRALEEKGFQSNEVSELAGAIANYNLPFIQFLEAFCNANPNLPHMAEVRLADVYASQDRMDETTARSRQFLSKLRGSEGEKNPSAYPVLLTLMGRAYLLMTAAYTRLGARTYSKRILQKALSLSLPAQFDARLKNELQTLDIELEDSTYAAIDEKWESFFSDGLYYDELQALCTENKFPQMSKRLELLEGNFRFKSDFKVDEAEMLMDIFIYQGNETDATPTYALQ